MMRRMIPTDDRALRGDSKEVLKTRAANTDAFERICNCDIAGAMGTPETLCRKRNRAMAALRLRMIRLLLGRSVVARETSTWNLLRKRKLRRTARN